MVNKKENLPNSGLCRPADHKVKLKESEKSDKYQENWKYYGIWKWRWYKL